MGIDIGRFHDLTCVSTLLEIADRLYVESIDTFRNMEFSEQERNIIELITLKQPTGVAIDSTGIGAQLGETLWKRYGDLVEPFNFSNASKVGIFNNVKKWMGQGKFWIPNDPNLKTELASIKRIARENTMVYQADRNAGGHADRATSVMLGGRAYSRFSENVGFFPTAWEPAGP